MSELAEKPLRADARRNREKVLAAARAVFAEQGVDAQMDDVARRADVGVGTVYRHFPTKDALLNALTDELFAVIAAHARELLDARRPVGGVHARRCGSAPRRRPATARSRRSSPRSRSGPHAPVPARRTCTITIGELMRALHRRRAGCAPTP